MDKATFKESLRPRIIQAARGKNFTPRILHGLIEKESNYRIYVSSPTGVRGLCQITSSTAKEVITKNSVKLIKSNIYLPENQIVISSLYLQNLLDRSFKEHRNYTYQQHLTFALQAYNCGYNAMSIAIKKGGWSDYKRFLPTGSDRHYAEKVIKNSETWKSAPTAELAITNNSKNSSNDYVKGDILPILGLILGGCYLFTLGRRLFVGV